MKLDTKHYRGNECFVPHAIEAEDYVGTIWNDRGEHRHIVPRDEASEWSTDGTPVVTYFAPDVVIVDAAPEEVKVATEDESGKSTLGGEKANDTNEVLGVQQGRAGAVAAAGSNSSVPRRTTRTR